MKLIAELKRRNVFRVAIFYIVSAWLLLQIADLLFEVLLVPDWTLRFIFGLLLAAFPFVLFFAWAYELTPEGIKRDADVAPQERSSATGGKLDRAIILLLVVLLAAVGYGQWRSSEPVSPEPIEPVAQGGTSDETADDAVAETDESPAETAIAVLPFANMSGAAENEYFSDGLSETLLHLLARIPELQVVARTSSFQFKGRNEDVRKIGRQLNVGHVLEGSVQRAGERVRITAQLIDTQNGYHLWSETFDRTLEDVFAVQDEIAASVVDALKLQLLEPAPTSRAMDPAVYDDLLRAQALLRQRGATANAEALSLLQTLVAREPENALVHARLASAHRNSALGGELLEVAFGNAVASAERAIALDPALAEGHAELGITRMAQRLPEQARPALERAIELAPNDAEILQLYASAQILLREIEAGLATIERAVRIDPLNREHRIVRAGMLAEAGRAAPAIEDLRQLVTEDPDDVVALRSLGRTLVANGGLAEALGLFRRLSDRDPADFSSWQDQYEIYMSLELLPEAGEALARMNALNPDRAIDELAFWQLASGDIEAYLESLRRYNEARSWGTGWNEIRIPAFEGDLEPAREAAKALCAEEMSEWWQFMCHTELAALAVMTEQQAEFEDAHRTVSEILDAFLTAYGDTPRVLWMAAESAASAGRVEEAVGFGRRALEAGFHEWSPVLRGDRVAFWPIRDSEEYRALLAEIRARNAQIIADLDLESP